jgi:enoyl-CoA hydratase/carnithine racemase
MTDLAPLTFDGPVATLTLNRPDKRNSLSIELLDELIVRLEDFQERDDVRVLVLTGAGKAFCAGMDLKAVLGDPAAPGKLLGLLGDFLLALRRLPVVSVARVNGAAIGGGCGLATVCDLAVTHADSKMGFPEVDLGVCPAVVAPWLVRKVGAGRARRILLQGGTMNGQQAFEQGIVDQVVDTREGLDDAVGTLVSRLAMCGAGAMRATKDLLNQLDGSLDAGLAQRSAELSARVLMTAEAQAMLRAKLSS